MTVATTATTELNVAQKIKMGLFHAGQLAADDTPDAGQLAMGMMFLQEWLASLQNKGVIVRASERVTVATVAGVDHVDTDADTISIEMGAVIVNTNGSQFEMEKVSRLAFQRGYPDKTVQGKPNVYMAEQLASGAFRIFLWQVPTTDWPTVIYIRGRRLKDVNIGTVTVDLDTRWDEPTALALGMRFARHYGRVARQASLKADLLEATGEAIDNETERGDAMLVFDSGLYGRRC